MWGPQFPWEGGGVHPVLSRSQPPDDPAVARHPGHLLASLRPPRLPLLPGVHTWPGSPPTWACLASCQRVTGPHSGSASTGDSGAETGHSSVTVSPLTCFVTYVRSMAWLFLVELFVFLNELL